MISDLIIAFSFLLNVSCDSVMNKIEQYSIKWENVRYKFGGDDSTGMDCSSFTQILYRELFKVEIPRSCKLQYNFLCKIRKSSLHTGDLVFFTTWRRGPSHVGIYLEDDKFLHMSIKGLTITSLDKEYYKKRYIGAGRI